MNRREFLAETARAGALWGVLGRPGCLFARQAPATVAGQVLGGGKPLRGALVSDGCRVVRTDANGRYELATGPDSGAFVFVSAPRGYHADVFYVATAAAAETGRADFRLKPLAQPDRFDFVFMADMHIERRRWGIPKLKASLREINRLKPTPAFLWAQGDICLQGGMGKEYVECLKLCKIPVRNGAGNHEMMLAHKNPRDDYERLFGPTYYSFDWGGVHCIVLDGNKPIPGGKGWKAVHGAVEGSEMKWLRADLAAQPEGKCILVGVHIPIVSTYPERRHKSPKDAPYWEVTNDRELTDLFARHKVRLVLQGHMHENEGITVGGVEYAESISLSGSWWKSGAGFERGVDGTPRGYRIVSVDGGKVAHRYVSSCESRVAGSGEFVRLCARAEGGKAEFVFNCYDAPNGSTARGRIDGGPWQPMPAFAAVNKSIGLKMPHHFRLLAEAARLKPGRHAIEVRVTWPDGTVVAEKKDFLPPAGAAQRGGPAERARICSISGADLPMGIG